MTSHASPMCGPTHVFPDLVTVQLASKKRRNNYFQPFLGWACWTTIAKQPTIMKRHGGKTSSTQETPREKTNVQANSHYSHSGMSGQNAPRTMSVTLRLVPTQTSSAATGGPSISRPITSGSVSVGANTNDHDVKQTAGIGIATNETVQNIQHVLAPFVRAAISQKYTGTSNGPLVSLENQSTLPLTAVRNNGPPWPPSVAKLPGLNDKCQAEAGPPEKRSTMAKIRTGPMKKTPYNPNIVLDYINSMKRRGKKNDSLDMDNCASAALQSSNRGQGDEVKPVPAVAGRPSGPRPIASWGKQAQSVIKIAPAIPDTGVGQSRVIQLNDIHRLMQNGPASGMSVSMAAGHVSLRQATSHDMHEASRGAAESGAPYSLQNLSINPVVSFKGKEPSESGVTVAVQVLSADGRIISSGQPMQICPIGSPMPPSHPVKQRDQLVGLKSEFKLQFQLYINTLQGIHNFTKVNELRRLINWRTKFELQMLLVILNGLVMATVHAIPMGKLKDEIITGLRKDFQKIVWFLKNSRELVGIFYLYDHGSDPIELQLLRVVGDEVISVLQEECKKAYGSAPKVVHNCMKDVERSIKTFSSQTTNRTGRGKLLVQKVGAFLRDLKKGPVVSDRTLEELVRSGTEAVTAEGQICDAAQEMKTTGKFHDKDSKEEQVVGNSPSPKTANGADSEDGIIDVVSSSPEELPVIETFSNSSVESDENTRTSGARKRRLAIRLPFKKRFRSEKTFGDASG